MASSCDSSCLETVSIIDTNSCISLIGSGTGSDPLRAQIGLSPLTDNIIECNADGLYVSGDALAETITTLTQAGSVLTYTSENGSIVTVDICATVASFCNSSFVVNADGSATFTDNAGGSSTLPAPVPETITTFTVNPDGSATYISENNTVTTLPAPGAETVTTLTINPDGSVTYVSENGTVTTVPAVSETTSTLVDNGNSTYTYTDETGTAVTFSVTGTTTTLVDNNDGTLSYTNEAGVTNGIDICNLVATHCANNETITTLVLNPDGSFTYTSEDGSVTTVPVGGSETITTFVLNPDGSATYTSEDGSVTTLPSPTETITTLADNGDGSFTHTSEDGTAVTIPAPPTQAVTTLVDNGNQTFTYTSEDGTITTIDFCSCPEPGVSLLKEVASVTGSGLTGIPIAGDTITYQLTVINEGDVDLTNINISDPLATVTGGPLATLPVGSSDSTTFTATYDIVAGDSIAGFVSNQASVSTDEGVSAVSDDPLDVTSDSDPTILMLCPEPADLTLTPGNLDASGAVDPADVQVNEFVTYTNAATIGANNYDLRITVLDHPTTAMSIDLGMVATSFSVFLTGSPAENGATAKFRFDWFDAGTTNLSPIPFGVTMKDIDMGAGGINELVEILESEIVSYALGNPSDVSVVPASNSTHDGTPGDFLQFTNTASSGGTADENLWASVYFGTTDGFDFVLKRRNGNTGYSFAPDTFADGVSTPVNDC